MGDTLLGRLSGRGRRSCGCCDHGRSKRAWKRWEDRLWRREARDG